MDHYIGKPVMCGQRDYKPHMTGWPLQAPITSQPIHTLDLWIPLFSHGHCSDMLDGGM